VRDIGRACSSSHERFHASITKPVKPSTSTHQYQDLHCIKPDYIDPNINIKLYDYIKLRQDHRRILHHLHQHGLLPPPTKTPPPP
jgi:hypothetical protein